MGERTTGHPSSEGPTDRLSVRVAAMRRFGERVRDAAPVWLRGGVRRALSVAFFVVIGVVLFRQLSGTDWPEVLRSVPRSPWFYVVFLARYFLLPITDALSYSAVWAINLFRHFGAFLMKRLLNSSFSAGAGDVYFLLWTVKTLQVPYRKAFSAAKDVTLLSAAASNTVAVVVLGAYLAYGDLSLMESVRPGVLGLIIGVTLLTAFLSLLVICFRGRVLAIDGPAMWRILGFHGARSAARILLLGLQWTIGLPGSSFSDWISLLIVDLLVSRTPLVPSREFLFLSLALGLAGTIDAPQAQVTALFLTDTALMQVGAVGSLIAAAVWRAKPHPLPRGGAEE